MLDGIPNGILKNAENKKPKHFKCLGCNSGGGGGI